MVPKRGPRPASSQKEVRTVRNQESLQLVSAGNNRILTTFKNKNNAKDYKWRSLISILPLASSFVISLRALQCPLL